MTATENLEGETHPLTVVRHLGPAHAGPSRLGVVRDLWPARWAPPCRSRRCRRRSVARSVLANERSPLGCRLGRRGCRVRGGPRAAGWTGRASRLESVGEPVLLGTRACVPPTALRRAPRRLRGSSRVQPLTQDDPLPVLPRGGKLCRGASGCLPTSRSPRRGCATRRNGSFSVCTGPFRGLRDWRWVVAHPAAAHRRGRSRRGRSPDRPHASGAEPVAAAPRRGRWCRAEHPEAPRSGQGSDAGQHDPRSSGPGPDRRS
jgi:hypothetical protein